MFIAEKPIENESDDILNRKSFAHHLGDSLVWWKEKESLVMGLYWEWWIWKSSIINLTKKYIDNLDEKDKPTIIEFNPWSFSEQDNLTNHFFKEIAKELELKWDWKNDTKIANKIRLYASILSFTPSTDNILNIYYIFLVLTWAISITATQIDKTLPLYYVLLWVWLFSLVMLLLKKFLLNMIAFFDAKSKVNSKTLTEVKKDIVSYLEKRNKKLVIIIDDIDRLNEKEIKEIFRLVRVNADFPNTIYILPFDRKIIEENLDEQNWVSGKEYLDKIVQVWFNVPFVYRSEIHKYLFEELNKILDNLPKSYEEIWTSSHWSNIYHSWFKNLFKNIRDIKRFSNSLKFWISQMHNWEVIEINAADFIWIEAIRVFCPELYDFIKVNKTMFTHTDSNVVWWYWDDTRKNIKLVFEEEVGKIKSANLDDAKALLFALFPNVEGICKRNTHYWSEWQDNWTRDLKICSSNFFDTYFSFIPWWNTNSSSKLEINNILDSMKDLNTFEVYLNNSINKKTINKDFKIIQKYTWDEKSIPENIVKIVIQWLLNISDDIPDDDSTQLGIFSFFDSPETNLWRIIYQLLKRERSKEDNFNIIYETISNSKGFYWILHILSTVISDEVPSDLYIETNKHKEIVDIAISRIKEFANNWQLLKSRHCLRGLYRWKKATDNEKDFVDYLNSMLTNNDILVEFLSSFINIWKSESSEWVKTTKSFNHNALNEFYSKEQVGDIKNRLLQIKKENLDNYKKNKEVIDLYFKEDNDEDI